MTSCVGVDCLESYKASKFTIWQKNMETAFGGCAAAFLPEIKRGFALNHVYDHMIFPVDIEERAEYEAEHRGKIVSIPRPVKMLRIWNSATGTYDEISPHMPGSPTEENKHEFWGGFLNTLREKLNPTYGDGFVDDCINLDPEEVKAKYF